MPPEAVSVARVLALEVEGGIKDLLSSRELLEHGDEQQAYMQVRFEPRVLMPLVRGAKNFRVTVTIEGEAA